MIFNYLADNDVVLAIALIVAAVSGGVLAVFVATADVPKNPNRKRRKK